MAMFDVTIRVRVEADSAQAAEDDVMQQANAMLSVDGVFLDDSEEADEASD